MLSGQFQWKTTDEKRPLLCHSCFFSHYRHIHGGRTMYVPRFSWKRRHYLSEKLFFRFFNDHGGCGNRRCYCRRGLCYALDESLYFLLNGWWRWRCCGSFFDWWCGDGFPDLRRIFILFTGLINRCRRRRTVCKMNANHEEKKNNDGDRESRRHDLKRNESSKKVQRRVARHRQQLTQINASVNNK